jgi:hypothetical protein
MVVALAFLKGIFARSLPMSQAHGLIIGEVYGPVERANSVHAAARYSPARSSVATDSAD